MPRTAKKKFQWWMQEQARLKQIWKIHQEILQERKTGRIVLQKILMKQKTFLQKKQRNLIPTVKKQKTH